MTIRNLVPNFILRQQRANNASGELQAVTMFVDISGFTKLTETLRAYQKDGAEVLTEILNGIFNPIVHEVYGRGGFVSTFAGDGFTTIFPLERPDAIRHALAAAFFVQGFFAEHGLIPTPYATFEMGVKVGLAMGNVQWGVLGSEGRLTYYVRGEAVDACAEAEHDAVTGDIIAHRTMLPFLPDGLETVAGEGFHKLLTFSAPPPCPDVEVFTPERDEVRLFMPTSVIDLTQRAEFRNVCSVFISYQEPPTERQINEFVSTMMSLVELYGGYFNKIDFGDKGSTALVLFGAPVSHENTVERAADFLLALRDQTPGVAWRAGFTFGPVYAGIMGGEEGCEYTAIGDTVNLSARMMMRAGWGEIWIGETVQPQLLHTHQITPLGSYEFKGKAGQIPVFRLDAKHELIETTFFAGKMVGRETELARLTTWIQPIFAGVETFAGVLYVYGEPGIGKSRLLHEFRQRLGQHHRFQWFYCPAEEILRQSLNPFTYFLRSYFQQSPIASTQDNKARLAAVLDDRLARIPNDDNRGAMLRRDLNRTRSVLGAMVDLYWENSLYEQLEPRLRFENKLSAFSSLIRAESLLQPVIIEIDGGHLLDPDSVELLRLLLLDASDYPIALLCTSRYNDDGSKFRLTPDDSIRQDEIELGYLAADDVKALAEQVLQHGVDESVVHFLSEKTNGNPYFLEQLALDLKERRVFATTQTEAGPVLSVSEQQVEDVPTTIYAVLISRLDRLAAEVKHVVQTASVLGREFETAILSLMLPEERRLVDIVEAAQGESVWNQLPDARFLFRQALLRDASYHMQLRSRLREMHRLAGEAVEEIYADDLSGYYPDLAYHFERAEITDKAVEYLWHAASHAQANYENQAALAFYDRLLGYTDADNPRRVDIHEQRGEIFTNTSQHDVALAEYKTALNYLLQQADPAGHQGKGAAVIPQSRVGVSQQGRIRYRPGLVCQSRTIAGGNSIG